MNPSEAVVSWSIYREATAVALVTVDPLRVCSFGRERRR